MEVWGLQTSSRESLSAPFTSPAMETKPRRCQSKASSGRASPTSTRLRPAHNPQAPPWGGSDETTRGRCKWEWLHQRKSGRPTGRITGQDEQRDGNPQDRTPSLSSLTPPSPAPSPSSPRCHLSSVIFSFHGFSWYLIPYVHYSVYSTRLFPFLIYSLN